jgi:hypothetical protein
LSASGPVHGSMGDTASSWQAVKQSRRVVPVCMRQRLATASPPAPSLGRLKENRAHAFAAAPGTSENEFEIALRRSRLRAAAPRRTAGSR